MGTFNIGELDRAAKTRTSDFRQIDTQLGGTTPGHRRGHQTTPVAEPLMQALEEPAPSLAPRPARAAKVVQELLAVPVRR
jgi:hypothetical protein